LTQAEYVQVGVLPMLSSTGNLTKKLKIHLTNTANTMLNRCLLSLMMYLN